MTVVSSTAAPVRCAVIGHPISHSKSPLIHQHFAHQFGLSLQYDRIDVEPEPFAATVQAFFADGGRGLNVTLPHKSAALALATRRQPRAVAAGAANTLGCDADGGIWADNTDGVGLIRDLSRLGLVVTGRRILLLGAGGAAAGVLPALLAERPAMVALSNRSQARAEALLAQQAAGPVRLAAPNDSPYDLIISSVSEGAAALLAPLPVTSAASGYDLNYGERAADTLAAMRERGLSTVHDGRGMLIEQAAESFALWHGLRPDTGPLHRDGF